MPTIKRQHIKLKRNSICPCDENDKREKPLKYKNCCLKEIQAKEQKVREMVHLNKEVDKAEKGLKEAIQFYEDHPILLPNNAITVSGNGGSDIIIP